MILAIGLFFGWLCDVSVFVSERNEQNCITESTYITVNISCFGHLSFPVTNILINMNWRSVMSVCVCVCVSWHVVLPIFLSLMC